MASLSIWPKWTPIFSVAVAVLLLAMASEAGKSKTFLRNPYSPQDQPQRNNYHQSPSFNRFRRNERDEFEGNSFRGPSMFRPSGSFNSRKGGPRPIGRSTDRSFHRYGGGPEAFLEPATTERAEPEEDMLGFKFSGSAGFGASRPAGNPRRGGVSKGGGTKGGSTKNVNPFSAVFDRDALPGFSRNVGGASFGGTGSPGFGTASGSASFGGSMGGSFSGSAGPFTGNAAPAFSGPPAFGGSLPAGINGIPGVVPQGASSNQGFGGSSAFFPGVAQSGRPTFNGNPGVPFAGAKTTFTGGFPGAGVPGNNPFASGSANIQFPPSSIFPAIPEGDSMPIIFPQGPDMEHGAAPGHGINLPFTIDDELAALLFGVGETTTMKPPLRVTSAEDENKIFSGHVEDGEEEAIPPTLLRRPETKAGCNSKPMSPANGRTDCSTYAGCRAVCNPGYQFPSGERRLYLLCEDGEWKVSSRNWDTLPDCEPRCSPPCENNGICLAPDVCQCPDNWEGDQCQIPKAVPVKKCSNKPPTPMNSRIFCSKDECSARCHEGYQFSEGTTRLSFQCENGNWVIQDSRWIDTPDCEPACDPSCQNGGRCIAPDLCECTQDFRGDRCQYPISNCDPKKIGFNGGYNCTGEGMEFGCALWCPDGVDFEFPAEDFYSCDYATSTWSPSPIPNCNYEFLFVTPGSIDFSTGTYPPGFVFTTTEEVKKLPGTCFTWSGAHYKSFDGRVFSFESSCPYTLLQDSSHGTFSVNLKTKDDCTGPSCHRVIQLFLDDEEYVLQKTDSDQPSLEYRETNLAIPGQMNGVVSERVAHYVVVKVAGLGLTIKWDMRNLVMLEINELLWNRTSGICGRRDGNKLNDWSYPDGKTEDNFETFLQTWQSKTIGDRCLDQPKTKNPCGRRSIASDASDFCSRLLKFTPCTQVIDADPFLAACRWDYCACESSDREACACESFSAFFRECTNAGVDLPGGWRADDFCPMECPRGMEYNPCMSAIQPRCGQPADSLRPEFCVEGCDCPAGLLLHNGKCIHAQDCPCTYHNKDYLPGDAIPNDCNSCTCLGGEWKCTEVKCGSRCAVVGDPHYTTFDGKRYDFMGKCSYTLVQGADFSIEAENTPCAGAISESMNFPASVVSQFPSCTKSVTVRLEGTTIRLKQKREVTVNGVEVKDLPTWVNGAYIKKASSIFVMVELDNGLDVWWDGQTSVYVDAPSDFRGQVSGLCGTFTDNQRDDFLTPEGDVENNAVAFANKWKTSERCPDQPLAEEGRPCDRHVQNKAVAEKYCAKVKSSLFAKCHLEVDPEPYYRDCLYDMCSCETKLDGCLCPTLASYAKECTRKGILIDWRAEVRECGVHCTGGQKYQVCGNSCTHTCLDIATNPNCKRKCVEGCNCPEGFSLDQDGICVPITECPCVYQAKEYKPGYEMLQQQTDGKDMVCECFNAGWNCWEPRDNDTVTKPPQVQCPEHLHEIYTDCMPEEENTCQTMHLRSIPGDLCRAGCICGPGYVRNTDTGSCIKHSQCPCHHGGRSYSEGDIIVEDCNTCECEGGQWVCTEEQCPGICSAWGESHYKTFDGRMFEFHGTCDYLLAKGKSPRSDSFEVTVQNVPCGTNGVTCAKSVTLRVGSGNSQEIVEFSRNKPTPTKNLTRTIIREAGVFVFAEVSDMGLVLQWDRGTRAYLRLDPSWKGKVRGLCGNYNDDEQDDFKTPSGGSSEVSVRIFGDSWRLQNYCPDSVIIKDTCSLHPHRKVWASEQCAVLKTDTFAPCHSEVPVEPYLERCQFDACGCDTGGDCHCLCTAVAAYAHECNIHGVYIAWRTPDFCPMQCDVECEHYESCIPTCPHETCDTLLDPSSPLCVQDACVEGCAKDVCPPGHVYKSATDIECVPKADCEKKCLEIDGEVYLEGDIISEDDCHTCICTRKKKICRGTPCAPTTTPIPLTPSPTPRISTPLPPIPGITPEEGDCRSGWSEFMSDDHPVIFRKNSDVERIPAKIKKSKSGHAFCERSQVTDISCRSVGTHRPHTEQRGVTCSLPEGLLCRGRDDAQADDACRNYEVAVYCNCSIATTEAPAVTTPVSPVTPPIISTPAVPPVTAPTPMTCEEEGWSKWYNLHYPDSTGEFEAVTEIRKLHGICPDHYISEVECRPVRGGSLEDVVTCDTQGARCRNSGGQRYCQDYEIRVRCECDCQDGLGMEDWRIPNESITASSTMKPDDAPHSARLFADWAWTAQKVDPNDQQAIQNEWLQVDLGEVKEVTGVTTQGHPLFDYYVERFAVQFSETGLQWDSVKEKDTSYALQFTGNTDSNTAVTNLFPEPVFARYIRIIPLQFYQSISLRLELKGCDVKETTTPAWPVPETTTPIPVCEDGWTEWMNTHTPSPGNWDDLDDLTSLSAKYSFCEPQYIVKTDCRVVGLNQPFELAGQTGVICNINNGLQCNDDLQAPMHCYDYEIRFLCDCSHITTFTTEELPFPSPGVTTPGPIFTLPPSREECTFLDPQIRAHDTDCRKFYECAPTIYGNMEYVEKECGLGTFFHPKSQVCDFEANVARVRPECKTPPPKIVVSTAEPTTRPPTTPTTTPEPCTGHFWTEWFNVSHPDVENGDFETFEKIRELGYDICPDMYIMDIECQYNQITEVTTGGGGVKGGTKGGRKSKKGGRRGPPEVRITPSAYTTSRDVQVTCSRDTGLTCFNSHQRFRARCEDYAIRVLCSCMSTQPTPAPAISTTPYIDVRESTVITTPPTATYVCPPGTRYQPNAISCNRVCLYYQFILQQTGECLREGDFAPACVNISSPVACPGNQYLRDKSTCVDIQDCNCRLPNGMAAPPGRVFRVDECEVCQCSNNYLMCDSSACVLTALPSIKITEEPSFECNNWTSWISGSSPVDGNESELLKDLGLKYPKLCRYPPKVECRVKDTKESALTAGQNIDCRPFYGLTCKKDLNPEGCKDYEVRFWCDCSDIDFSHGGELTESTTLPTTTYTASHLTNVTTTWRPYMDSCTDDKTPVKCALPCDRVCMYYKQVLRQNGFCELDGDCAPGCLEEKQSLMCPPGFYMLDSNRCVAVADCSCRLANGLTLPAGVWHDVSPCERCMCQNNNLLCEREPGCLEISTIEPTVFTEKEVTIEITPRPKISFQCNNWSPYFKKQKTSEGVVISLDTVKEHIDFPCEIPTNASCREAAAKLPASSLGQVLTCDPLDGLQCLDLENSKDCHDYEISFFCECEEESTIAPPETTLGPVVTLAPCDAWSPWINEFKPWHSDFEIEYKSLQQLRDQYGFCMEGQLAAIECVEAATGQSVASDKGTSCDVRYGFSCKNADQDRGQCLDYKIRYYCTCETTTVITTTFVPPTITLPSVCDPDKYIHLLKDVDDSALSSTRARNTYFGPSNARLYNADGSLNSKSWGPLINDKNQYLQIDLGSVEPLYGLEMGGNPTTRERVTAYMVQVSDDGTTWSYVPSNPDDPNSKPEEFRGPVSPTAPLKQMFKTPVEARYIRIKPTVWVRSIALRVEVIGCELPTVPTYPITLKPECEEPMGLENGEMSLQQITVSSVLNDDFYFYGKQNLPINAQPGKYTVGGAWVAQPKPEQFVRFDFLEPSKLSGVITQGRSDTDEWVESFKIRYSQDGKTWSTLQEPDGTDKVFPANYDRNTPVETKFDQMIQARYLEIRPETWKSNIAMRAEVLGCFHPYPEITTTPLPEFTTTFPPPPECTPCPGLPEEFYDRCETCTPGTYFDGQTCVPKPICPCYKDGNRYDIGSVFETVDCLECECLVGGQAECKEKTCDPCNDIDQGVLTTSCGCICKPCLEGTRLCPSINYCLNETSWCNGVVECPEDELDCPSTTPVIPLPCPTPYCPEFWQLTVRPSAGPCPIVKCEPPAKTTPMPCPIPFCPPLYDISLIPKKGNEMCPKYECIPPSTTMAPPECPPLLCPDGYEVQTSDDVVPEMPFGECPQYQCVTAAPPTAPCPPPTCPQGYDIFFADSKAILELCPPYDCIPIVTTTMCPPVECGEGLRTMYIQAPEGSACPQYTCVQVTTPTAITTEPPVTCPPMELPICKAGEELYQTNPNELCPRFGCKPFGMTPTPFPEAPRNITPTCTIEGRSFDSFDDSHYQVEPCNHILAEDKINKDWIITMHRNCSYSNSCDRYLKITQDDQQLILKPDLLIVWDENSYTVSQAQRIGTSRNAFTVSRVGDSIRFSSSVYKYSVEWNTEMNVRIEVGTELTNQVDGLCGFYTGYAHDDKTKPDGKLATTNKEYGQSWALDDQPCEEKPKCTVVQSAESFQLCEAIKNDPFTKCHSAVDPSSFLKGCVATTCDCLREGKDVEECRCQALTHYVTRCLESDSQMKLDDWRIVAKCYKECGPGERYQDCFRATCEKSCENLHDDKACMEREGACVPGCFCSPGLVRKGDRCVNPEKCGDCVCEGYGDPHYQTFDRQNYTFNGECSYVAARDKNVRGQHAFEVITRNKKCTIQPVTVCTDAVTVLFKDHTVFIENEGDSIVTVTVDGVDIPTFPHREPWLALEQPDAKQIMAAIPEIQLEVRYFLENFGFSVKVPSRLYFNKTEGLCGNCNYRTEDEFEARGTGLVESSDDFGMSWLLDNEPSSCGVIEKETTSCIPLPPDVDPCLRIMDEEIFGKCHPVEDPVPYVSSCQLDACGSREPEVAGCHSLEAYARRCAELDICLNWRSDVLCPKICPESLVFNPCGPGCVRTCENYQELNENPDACPISSVDGCFCPEGMVLDNGTCINETFCTACDDEGHRIGDVWQTDPCTTCECSIRGSSCSTKTCPDEPICDEGYEVVEVPDTGDACCGPRKKCRVIPVKDCPPTIEPKDECGYGQKHKVIEAPGVCPQYACVCVEPEECPALEVPDDDKLKPGEVWNLDDTGCCIRYKAECTDVCPEVECPEFYEPVEKPLQAGQCCPDVSCEPPSDACIYENIYVVDENGFQKTAEQPSGVKKGGRPQTSEPEKKLYKVGEKWDDGLCLKCSCSLDSTGKPRHMCTEQTCPTVDTHPDKDEFQLDSLQVPGQCCPDIVRTACIDDYEVIEIGERLDDPLNGCRSVECLRHPDGKVDKVEQIHTCDENCPLGWVYEPSPLYPHQCCGECVQVACVVEGEVKEVGDIWVSDDYCTTFTCAKENNRQIQIQAVEVKCTEPSAKDRQDYEYFETLVPGQCCPTYSRTSCLMDDIPIAAGDSVQDPLNNCLTVSCEKDKDGNVTRREKEITCDTDCALGQTYIEPIEGSNECCGKCLVTHCMDGGVAYSIGERWESEGDACYEYRCETRDMVLTTVAVKKDCPYFDPECPPEEIYMDDNGCCQLCNVTRPVKSDCKPTPMSLEETVGIFTLTARGVGTCKNTEPVVGFNQCYGHCDSYTQFVGQGRRGGYVSTCFCCKPAKFQKIRVDMRCETGYAFTRVYDNIVECECLRCDDGAPEYLGDEPILDDVDFFAMTEEPLDE